MLADAVVLIYLLILSVFAYMMVHTGRWRRGEHPYQREFDQVFSRAYNKSFGEWFAKRYTTQELVWQARITIWLPRVMLICWAVLAMVITLDWMTGVVHHK